MHPKPGPGALRDEGAGAAGPAGGLLAGPAQAAVEARARGAACAQEPQLRAARRAALARLKGDGTVAARFELYMSGLELCNGYFELSCANEQRTRIDHENERRVALGKSPYPVDEEFIRALESGLPDCAGNALGVDRLQMALQGFDDIGEVRSFRVET